MQNDLSQDCHLLNTRIPEAHTVEGLEYGRHVSTPVRSGYYVWPANSDLPMMVARPDPENADSDGHIIAAIEAEFHALTTTAERIAGAVSCAADAMSTADDAVADQDWRNGRMVYRFDDGSTLAVEGAAFGPITTAERVAVAFCNDGQRLTHATSGHFAGGPVRYVFTDGSAIVIAGEGWDIEGSQPVSWKGLEWGAAWTASILLSSEVKFPAMRNR